MQNNNNWVNTNRRLLENYKGQWVAFNYESGLIAHDTDYFVVKEKAVKSGIDYVFWHVPKYWGKILRILPIRFRTFVVHEWAPVYEVTLMSGSNIIKQQMLVDSGADVSLIPYKMGIDLGLEVAFHERISVATGIGGSVEYVVRDIEFTIDSHTFKAPVAWVQTPDCEDIILGREVVFDTFDIEFRQADEEIVFKLRKEKS